MDEWLPRKAGRISEAPCDGAVVGTARVNGRLIMTHASDFTVLGGSIGARHLIKFARPLEMAAQWGIPMVNLLGERLSAAQAVGLGLITRSGKILESSPSLSGIGGRCENRTGGHVLSSQRRLDKR